MKISIGMPGGSRKRGSNAGASPAAVLDAPEENYVSEPDTDIETTGWPGGGPAPAGALQRGSLRNVYSDDEFSQNPAHDAAQADADGPYIPRRGSMQMGLHSLPRSIGGRILLGGLVVVVLGAVGVAIAGVRYYLLHDERFVMTTSADIQIAGNEHLTRAQILSIFGADLERNIFKVSLGQRRQDLERLPWVQHATVMRLLPNRVRVSITERTPVAFVRQGSRIGLVDSGGVLLDMPPEAAGDPKYSFPVLTGLSADDPLSTRAARMEIYKRFMQELDSSKEHLTAQLSEVDVSNPEDVKAVIASGGSDILVHFGDENFLDRFHTFQQHLPEWKAQYPKLASADMRYEGQIVLEMQQGTAVPLAGDAKPDAPVTPVAADATTAPAAAAFDKPAPAKSTPKLVAKAPVKPARIKVKAVKPVTKPIRPPAITGVTP